MRDHYDFLIVGSSPINMMEAVHRAEGGASVLLLEEKPFLGGAWYTKNHWGLPNLEVGCHKIECSKAAYAFIDEIGAETWAMEPQPHLLMKGFPARGGPRRKLFYALLKVLNRVMGRGRMIPFPVHDRLEALLRRRWRPALEGFEYRYFRNGCAVLVAALEERARAAGVDVALGFALQRIQLTGARSWVEGACGTEIGFERCLVTPNTRMQVCLDGEEQPIRRQEFDGRHFLFRIEGRKLFDFLHIDILNSDLIRQLTDVGYYAGSDDLVLCANVLKRADAVQNAIPIASEPISDQERDQLFHDIFAAMKADGFISPESRLIDSFMESYPICSNHGGDIDDIAARSSSRLQVLWTLDLALGIERKLVEWSASDGPRAPQPPSTVGP